MGRLALHLALPAHRLFLHHRYSRPIHLDIQNRHRVTHYNWEIQLYGTLDRALLALSNIASDCLRRAFHRFGGHFQSGKDFHLPAAVIERHCRSNRRQHAAHAGRDFRVLHIQFHIRRELSLMASRT